MSIVVDFIYLNCYSQLFYNNIIIIFKLSSKLTT